MILFFLLASSDPNLVFQLVVSRDFLLVLLKFDGHVFTARWIKAKNNLD
jgi:hypothetical protein